MRVARMVASELIGCVGLILSLFGFMAVWVEDNLFTSALFPAGVTLIWVSSRVAPPTKERCSGASGNPDSS